MRYLYTVLRFVPDTVRGEFVNVGLLVIRDAPDTGVESYVREVKNWDRARSLSPGDDQRWRIASRLIDELEIPETSYQLNDLCKRYSNSYLQFRPPMPVSGDDAKKIIDDLLWNMFIVE